MVVLRAAENMALAAPSREQAAIMISSQHVAMMISSQTAAVTLSVARGTPYSSSQMGHLPFPLGLLRHFLRTHSYLAEAFAAAVRAPKPSPLLLRPSCLELGQNQNQSKRNTLQTQAALHPPPPRMLQSSYNQDPGAPRPQSQTKSHPCIPTAVGRRRPICEWHRGGDNSMTF